MTKVPDRRRLTSASRRRAGRGLSDDGRAVRVSLTPDGRRLASLLTDEIGGLITPMTRSLSSADQNDSAFF